VLLSPNLPDNARMSSSRGSSFRATSRGSRADKAPDRPLDLDLDVVVDQDLDPVDWDELLATFLLRHVRRQRDAETVGSISGITNEM